MTQAKTIGQLKAAAREGLLGKYSTVITAILIYLGLESGIGLILQLLIPSGSVLLMLLNLAAAFIVELLFGILVSGLAYLYLNIIYGQPVSVSDLFFGLSQHPEKAVMIQAVFTAVETAVLIPVQLLRSMGADAAEHASALPLVFLMLGCVCVGLVVRLTYSQAFFLLHDYPDRSVGALLRTSRRLMQGMKLRLFVTYLSFLPYLLVGIVTLFVPLLWVRAYMETTLAAFYQDLVAQQAAHPVIHQTEKGKEQ